MDPIFFVEVLDGSGLFIDKKVILDINKNVCQTVAATRLSANFLIRITFFPFNLDTSPFQVKVF
jgi:hypothetical protein